jgi:predicted ATPase/class 3 adenylate cyclase
MPAEGAADQRVPVPAGLPTGTVTFLFTDIEGSTQRWERQRDAMDAAVQRHDEILRSTIERNHGYVFKMMGDAVCAAFQRVSDAIAATVEAQRALSAAEFSAVDDLRVRMGIHSGEASERDGDYFGPAVNRVARLMSIGHGGQVLISDVARTLADSQLPAGATLTDMGTHRLKDLGEPEHVWQLSIADMPASFPPLKSIGAQPNNLPVPSTTLRGRERDLQDVKALIGEHRVLTIVGSGGIGKTRLALQIGADLLDEFVDGVWFADISAITEPELVSSVVASALGIAQVQGRRVDELIPQRLKHKRLLLIIDNCEQVLGAVADLVDAIARNAPEVRILCTSRQALGIAGETAHRLPSLDVPKSGSTFSADQAIGYGAIAVFADRAKSADTRFVLQDDNAAAIADICRRLDGIPLAIELAAARVKVLSIPGLAQRLGERFKLLTVGSRTALPRQQTLTALIDWSFDLLTPAEQRLFARLSVFAGGFSLGAAARVCGDDGQDESAILDLLASLTDKSLIVAETAGEQARYRMLESTSAYASDKLIHAGDRELLARAHAAYFRDLAQSTAERFSLDTRSAWLVDLERELDNYRAALVWSISQKNDPRAGGAITIALGNFWMAGLAGEGRYWITQALELLDEHEHPLIAARLWFSLANLTSVRPQFEAANHALKLFESIGDSVRASRVRLTIAHSLYSMGDLDEAQRICDQLLASESDPRSGSHVTNVLELQGCIASERGNLTAARSFYAQALVGHRSAGDKAGIAGTLANSAELEFMQGNAGEAIRLTDEALSYNLNYVHLIALRLNGCAYRISLDEFAGARAFANEAIRLARIAQIPMSIGIALQHLALIGALKDRHHDATRLLGYIDARFKALAYQRESTEQWGYEKLMAVLREKLSDAEIDQLAVSGAAWTEDQAVDEALGL